MDWLYLVGRVLFAMIFVGSGFWHFAQLPDMTQYAEAKGLGAAKAMVVASGFMILLGGFSVLLGVWMEIGVWLLVLFLLASAFLMHNYWKLEDPMQKQVEMGLFMRNLSLAGAGLIMYWMVQTYGYGPFVLGQPL